MLQAGSPSRGRAANYTQVEVGALVRFAGCVNFVVEENDLFGTWSIFVTGGKTAAGGDAPASSGGIIRGNTIWNGGGVTDFDTVRRVIFEDNSATGVALASFGNNIANYDYMQVGRAAAITLERVARLSVHPSPPSPRLVPPPVSHPPPPSARAHTHVA